MTQTTSMEDNYHQRHQYTTIHEAEHHTDHNQEVITIVTHIPEITEITKRIENQRITITEVSAIIKTIIVGTEVIQQ